MPAVACAVPIGSQLVSTLIVRGRLIRPKESPNASSRLPAPDTPPARVEHLPAPAPTDDQLLVRVHASSVNPVDNAIAAGMLRGMGIEHEFPVVLGRDYAGIVEQVGADVSRFARGDAVYGFILHANPTVHEGAWAELVTVPEQFSVAPAPDGVDLDTAGAAPLAGITALTAIDALELSDTDVLLVVGAAGGVGSLAVQLAARAGATVIAPGLPEDEEYLRALGVTAALLRDGDLVGLVRERYPDGVDALLDLVSYASGAFDGALKTDACVASPNGAAGDGPGRTNAMSSPTPDTLQRLGALLADGTLGIPVQASYDLTQAPEALTALAGTHTQGKVAIRVR